MSAAGPHTPPRPTPISSVLALTVLASFGTGILWNGMPFIAEHDYDFSEVENFGLFTIVGLVYVVAAFLAGRLIRRIESTLSARSLLAILLIAQSALAMIPLVADAEWMIWMVTIGLGIASALFWPVVESYLSAGRAGKRLRFAIGLWNVLWTLAVAISLIGLAPLMSEGSRLARYAIVGLAGLNIFGTICLVWFRRQPLAPGHASAAAEAGREYPYLLHAARILLPTSYFLVGMISPLMPYRLEVLEVASTYKTPLTATWMFTRVGVIVVMWLLPFWHGRWGTLLLAGGSMVLGYLGMLMAPTVWLMFTSLAIFGFGQGITYYAAIYYAMSVGNAEVDAAGTHESLIGAGYAGGPLAGLVTVLLVGGADPATTIAALRIGLILLVMTAAGWFALQPYRRARRERRNSLA